jgi:hypothetical protein
MRHKARARANRHGTHVDPRAAMSSSLLPRSGTRLWLLLACLCAVTGSARSQTPGGADAASVKCQSVEFIIAADGVARRLAERGLADPPTGAQVIEPGIESPIQSPALKTLDPRP